MFTPSSNASDDPENNPPSEELRQLTLGEYDDAQVAGLVIRSVDPVGDSPDTPAVQLDNDDAGIMVESSRRRQVDGADIDDTDTEGRNVRQRIAEGPPRVAEEFEELENESEWTIMRSIQSNQQRDRPLSGGVVVIINGRRIPCQKIGGNPLGNDPLGEHGGWYWNPIYRMYNGKSGEHGVRAVKQTLNAKHFNIEHHHGTGEEGARMPERWWNIVNGSNNIVWRETGFSILGIEGVGELFGTLTFTGTQLQQKKGILADYGLKPIDRQWPKGKDVTKWTEFPIHIVHSQGHFHGNEGGEEDAKKILRMDKRRRESRKRAKVVMNHFFLLNPQLRPSDNSRVALEKEEWLKLRDGSEGEDIEEMWDQIVSGTIV